MMHGWQPPSALPVHACATPNHKPMCGLINAALPPMRTCDRHAQAHIHHALLDAARPKCGCDCFMHQGDAAQRLTVPPRREQ